MAQTVIGIFDNSAEAQQAIEQLRFIGVSDDRIDLSSANNTAAGTTTATTSSQDTDDHDGIGGFFRSLFGDDDDDNARAYSHVARHSDCLVTVHAQSAEEAQRAAEVLDRYGAVDVDERAAQYGYNRNSMADTMQPTAGVDTTDNTSIPVIEENIEVGKREVQTGGARLRSRIVERPVEEHLRLRSEHIRVERRPVDRPATDADFNSFREGDLEVTERAEVPLVNKQARVVEEVSLGKEVEEHEEVVRDTVRSTEVDVDRLDGTTDRTGLDIDDDRTDLDNDRGTAF